MTTPYTIDEQIAEIEREIQMREQVYPRQIQARRMTETRAAQQIGRMRAVLETLRHAKEAAKGPA